MHIPFLHTVRKTIERHGMLELGDRVLVAFSGGPDSTALVHVLLALREKYGLRLALAHIDHGLRKESKEDAKLVRKLAKSLGLPCYMGRRNVARFCSKEKLSLEEGAREVRYAFLEETAKKSRCAKIALGHTMDDQAETVLMRLIRGTGPHGLKGIPPVRGKIIRPLIEVPRKEISAFLGKARLSFLTDPSNRDMKFLRNRIRLQIIPLLQSEFNPRIVPALARAGQLLAGEEVRMSKGKQGWGDILTETYENETTKIVLDLSKIMRYNKGLQREAIREALRKIRGSLRQVGFTHVDAVLDLVKGRVGGVALLPGGYRASKGYHEIIFEKSLSETPPRAFAVSVTVPGVTNLPVGKLKTMLLPASKAPKVWQKLDGREAWFDAERIRFPLKARTRKEGDKFRPLGHPGPKRLKEILIDDKVPRDERDTLPLLVDQEDILWIAGVRRSEQAKLTSDTKRALKVTFIPSGKEAR